jgi:LmbE family N-acetylglucosaminyl deacetylase
MKDSILAIYAHPDDEAFSTGGALACYAASGVDVYLVCATRGEAGEISDPSFATPENLGEVREDELRCAAETMGVKELIFLDYRDSGMEGTPENEHPDAFINAAPEQVVPTLVGIIRRLRPKVVVTFEPNGVYGHPDHIAIHNHTVAAYQAAADPAQYPGQGPAWEPQRLFYSAVPNSYFMEMRRLLEEQGEDTSEFQIFESSGMGWPDENINVTLDVSETVDEKWQALNCHRTQFGPGNLFRRIPIEQVKILIGKEHFALASPEATPGARLASLFEGIESV